MIFLLPNISDKRPQHTAPNIAPNKPAAVIHSTSLLSIPQSARRNGIAPRNYPSIKTEKQSSCCNNCSYQKYYMSVFHIILIIFRVQNLSKPPFSLTDSEHIRKYPEHLQKFYKWIYLSQYLNHDTLLEPFLPVPKNDSLYF